LSGRIDFSRAVKRQTIGYLERGEYNPSLELALRIAEHFGLPVEAIFSRAPFVPMSQQLYPPIERS
jgi:DNA-binding XRE family transcriptional regulator